MDGSEGAKGPSESQKRPSPEPAGWHPVSKHLGMKEPPPRLNCPAVGYHMHSGPPIPGTSRPQPEPAQSRCSQGRHLVEGVCPRVAACQGLVVREDHRVILGVGLMAALANPAAVVRERVMEAPVTDGGRSPA